MDGEYAAENLLAAIEDMQAGAFRYVSAQLEACDDTDDPIVVIIPVKGEYVPFVRLDHVEAACEGKP